MPPKKRKTEDAGDENEATPRKSRRMSKEPAVDEPISAPAATPSKRKSILRGTPSKVNGTKEVEATPKSLRKVLFSTPSKVADEAAQKEDETPTATRNDRSARRKSAKVLQSHTLDDVSEDEKDAGEAAIAKGILDEDDSEEDDEEIESVPPSSTANTPSKRGRPKGKRRERTPSPPPDLPPHELYFFQNRTGANKTSSNTLSSRVLLNHEDYFAHINAYKDPHEIDIKRLKQYHRRAFDQWMFELEEGFNLCLYGYGSKRQLAIEFAEHLYNQAEKAPKIVVVNGYTPGLMIRDILIALAAVILPKSTKLPAQPTPLLDLILSTLNSNPPPNPVNLLIHSLDHANLRKSSIQSILSRLASHPRITLLATVDTPNFPLLWDTTHLRQYRWLYHDATTFTPYTVEIDVVDDVNALLGRSGRRLGGKDGVGFVLKSLPENARNLFRILVAEQLSSADVETEAPTLSEFADMDSEDLVGEVDEDEAADMQNTPSRRGRGRRKKEKAKPVKPTVPVVEGVEYRALYHKAVEEFVCSSELNFRTLLKEFHDHQMIESRKDAMGTERLVVPFRREELEAILEELA